MKWGFNYLALNIVHTVEFSRNGHSRFNSRPAEASLEVVFVLLETLCEFFEPAAWGLVTNHAARRTA